jgi:hypothetical protein
MSARVAVHRKPRPATRDRLPTAAAYIVPLLALILGLISLFMSHQTSIGDLGLVQALVPTYDVSVLVVLCSFVFTWRRGSDGWALAVHVVVLVVLLHGAPAIVENQARFPTAWLHAGFTDYVAHTGSILPRLDARFNWPSFFSGTALLMQAAGVHSATAFLNWWPAAINLLYLPLVFIVARRLLNDDRTPWLAVMMFPVLSWVGQDYYSPQSVAFLLYLALVAIVIVEFPRAAVPRPLARLVSATQRGAVHGADSDGLDQPGRQAYLLLSLVALDLAFAISHQLTPVTAIAVAIGLVVVGRTRLAVLPVIMTLITLTWISYGAVAYWQGHIGNLFGPIGQVRANVDAGVANRLSGSSAHELVVYLRLIFSLLVWAVATLGVVRLWRRRRPDLPTLLVLMYVPFIVVAGQSYGGEATLRVYLYTLPVATTLIAGLIGSLRVERIRAVAALAVPVFALPLFLLARWGNESFEQIRSTELAGMRAFYGMAPQGATLIAIDPKLPWRFDHIADYRYRSSEAAVTPAATLIRLKERAGHSSHGAYVIITTGQLRYGEQSFGLPVSWGTTLVSLLSRSPEFQLVYKNPDTLLYKLRSEKAQK